MFGTPNYKELDPTLPMAILYIFMFGAMFGDAGHGAIIAIMGLLLMIPKKMKGIRWLAQILVMVGLSSILFGFLYGAMFGEEYHLINPLWLSPSDNIMTILAISAAFGALVISVGSYSGRSIPRA
jgi:V/A-type H+-transporting ATPase subunit I